MYSNLLHSISVFFRSALDALVSNNFPLSSRDFEESNPKYSDYIAALDQVCFSVYPFFILKSQS